MPVETDPVQLFGSLLRTLRERVGMSQKELASQVYCSASLISGIETGSKPAKRDLVKQIDEALRAGGALLLVWPITTMGTYRSWFARVAALEADAIKIHEWEMRVVPGLLQTEEYARAMIGVSSPRQRQEDIEESIRVRMKRQEVFDKENPPMAWFILDESVLHRPFGGRTVMYEQLAKLEQMSESARIVIQILPFVATDQPGMEGPLWIMEFMDSPTIWYTEGWDMGRMVETRADVADAMTCFDLIRASALCPEKSRRLIAEMRSKYATDMG